MVSPCGILEKGTFPTCRPRNTLLFIGDALMRGEMNGRQGGFFDTMGDDHKNTSVVDGNPCISSQDKVENQILH